MLKTKKAKILLVVIFCIVIMTALSITVFAAGDVAGAVEGVWGDAKNQTQRIVNNVVFPVIDLILTVIFFITLAMTYKEYKKSGQVEWTAPALLFAGLLISLTAPLYIWQIIG